ncbi:MAG: 16S rRNA (guanine(966)-N(2))-methyltransferase RsmD [Ardenticatenaceae bacterium]
MPRIIAGTLGGRVIESPPRQNLRPMMSKVRAALFDMLWHIDVLHGHMLDLYAGTGAVGIEALSRGMEAAYFVEFNPVNARTIRKNLAKLRVAEQGYVYRRKVEDVIAKPALLGRNKPFELISVTPPYEEVDFLDLARRIGESQLIAPDSVVVFEHPRQVDLSEEIGPLVRIRDRRYGGTKLSIYEYPAEIGDGE